MGLKVNSRVLWLSREKLLILLIVAFIVTFLILTFSGVIAVGQMQLLIVWLRENSLTLASLVVAFVALGIGLKQTKLLMVVSSHLQSLSSHLQGLSSHLQTVSSHLQTVSSHLQVIAARSHMSLAVSRLNSPGWISYKTEAQVQATPEYLQRWQEGYVLTEKGEKMLPLQYKEMVKSLVKKDREIPINEVILQLNLGGLLGEAIEKNIAPDVMIGIVATYVEKAKAEIK